MEHEGSLHVSRSGSNTYMVVYAPYGPTGTGGWVPNHDCRGDKELRDFLSRAHVGPVSIEECLKALANANNHTIGNVRLSQVEWEGLSPPK
jgi:hypothetical protein